MNASINTNPIIKKRTVKSIMTKKTIMKKTMLLGLALIIGTLGAQAQWGGKKIKGNGNVKTIERNVGDYDGVALAGWFDVILVDGNEGGISLKGESNLLEYVVTEVKNGTLKIRTKKGYQLKPSNWKDGIVITVPVEAISSVAVAGSGDMVSETTLKSDAFSASVAGSGDIDITIDANDAEAAVAGSGDIVLSGQADSFEAKVSGSGDIKAYDLKANDVEAYVSGSADVKVYVTGTLTARVSGSGDVSYKGNPEKVDSKVSGSGDVTGYRK